MDRNGPAHTIHNRNGRHTGQTDNRSQQQHKQPTQPPKHQPLTLNAPDPTRYKIMWTRLRALLPTGPPGPLFHATILCCQTGGLAFGIRAYLSEEEKSRTQTANALLMEEKRRDDAAALEALDRTAAYFNARRPEKAVLELEIYRGALVKEGGNGNRPWADVWLERRTQHEPRAMEMEMHRVELKNLWYMSKHAWEGHLTRRDLMHEFFFDAPLNAALAMRSLHLLEPMDRARSLHRGVRYERPSVYCFLEVLYALRGDVDGQPSCQPVSGSQQEQPGQPHGSTAATLRKYPSTLQKLGS